MLKVVLSELRKLNREQAYALSQVFQFRSNIETNRFGLYFMYLRYVEKMPTKQICAEYGVDTVRINYSLSNVNQRINFNLSNGRHPFYLNGLYAHLIKRLDGEITELDLKRFRLDIGEAIVEDNIWA